MSWTGNTCEKGRFWGIQGISGHCAVKFLVVALVLLIGAGCNLQVRKNGKSGLRSLPRAAQNQDSQVTDSKEVVIVSSDSIGKDKPISVEPDPEQPDLDQSELDQQEPGNVIEESGSPSVIAEQVLATDLETDVLQPENSGRPNTGDDPADDAVGLQRVKTLSLTLPEVTSRPDKTIGGAPVLASLTKLPEAVEPAGPEKIELDDGGFAASEPITAGKAPDEEESEGEVAPAPELSSSPAGENSGEDGTEAEASSEALNPDDALPESEPEIPVSTIAPATTDDEPGTQEADKKEDDAPAAEATEQTPDETETGGKSDAGKPPEGTGTGGSPGAQSDQPAEDGGDEKADAGDAEEGSGDAAGKESSEFPKGYLIVLVVCLGLAVFKKTAGSF